MSSFLTSPLDVERIRCPIRSSSLSPFSLTTPSRRTRCLSPLSGPLATTRRFTPSLIRSSLNDGWRREVAQSLTPRTTWSGERVPTRSLSFLVPLSGLLWLTARGLPTQCIGFEYAYMHLAACVGTASVTMDWEHKLTPDSGKLQSVSLFSLMVSLSGRPIDSGHPSLLCLV